MSTEYTLSYFNSRGLAEPIRMILSYAGATWKDVRIPLEPPYAIPEDIKALCPFGQIPILEFDGQVLGQSAAIARHLARKFKLTGKDEWEASKCDEIVDAVTDFRKLFSPVYFEEDEEKKAQLISEAAKTAKESYLSRLNQILADNGGKNMVGSALTWADITLAHFIQNLGRICQVQLADGLPALQALIETVFQTPGIKEYAATRPDTKF